MCVGGIWTALPEPASWLPRVRSGEPHGWVRDSEVHSCACTVVAPCWKCFHAVTVCAFLFFFTRAVSACCDPRRSEFIPEGSTPRRGRRVLPVTLGRHHKQTQTLWVGADRAWLPCPRSGRSRSTRCGAQSAVGRAKRRVDQNRRTIHDSQHQRVQTCLERVQSRQRGLET